MITHIERTIEGVLVRFVNDQNARETNLHLTEEAAVDLGTNLIMVAALGRPADPAELLVDEADGSRGQRWSVTYRCGCTATGPSSDGFRDQCPQHGAEQDQPPHLEAAA